MPFENLKEDDSSEDYDLVPHKKIIELQNEVENIKLNPLSNIAEGRDMLKSMEKLTESMNELVSLFRGAAEEMKAGKKAETAEDGSLKETIADLIEQNSKIAKGIIAVADMVKELKEEGPKKFSQKSDIEPLPPIPPPPGFSRPMPPQGMGGMGMPPPPGMGIGTGMPPQGRMPSPPPGGMPQFGMPEEKKKGMFSFR